MIWFGRNPGERKRQCRYTLQGPTHIVSYSFNLNPALRHTIGDEMTKIKSQAELKGPEDKVLAPSANDGVRVLQRPSACPPARLPAL